MTQKDRRPGGHRSAVDDQPAGEVSAEDNPGADILRHLRRRRAASWRLPPLSDGRSDPLDPVDEPITDAELDSWCAAWHHLHSAHLPAIVPPRVVAAGRARRCTGRCHGHGDAA